MQKGAMDERVVLRLNEKSESESESESAMCGDGMCE